MTPQITMRNPGMSGYGRATIVVDPGGDDPIGGVQLPDRLGSSGTLA